MSNRQSKLSGVRFEPIPEHAARAPGDGVLFFGVIYPAVVIALELVSRMCAKDLFDPMPTYWHALAVGFVPASNLLVWKYLQHGTLRGIKWLAFANGAAIAISGFYAILFLPLLPLALLAIIVAVGLLPLRRLRPLCAP